MGPQAKGERNSYITFSSPSPSHGCSPKKTFLLAFIIKTAHSGIHTHTGPRGGFFRYLTSTTSVWEISLSLSSNSATANEPTYTTFFLSSFSSSSSSSVRCRRRLEKKKKGGRGESGFYSSFSGAPSSFAVPVRGRERLSPPPPPPPSGLAPPLSCHRVSQSRRRPPRERLRK